MDKLANLNVRDAAGGAVIAVKVVPGASRDRVVGVLGDCLKIATAAPPEKGKANDAVARILAESLGVDRRAVRLVAGATAARKEFAIDGLGADHARDALARKIDHQENRK